MLSKKYFIIRLAVYKDHSDHIGEDGFFVEWSQEHENHLLGCRHKPDKNGKSLKKIATDKPILLAMVKL